MKLKAPIALLIWIAPLASPLLPSQADCESPCCMVEVGTCLSEMSMAACSTMDIEAAPHTVPAVVGPQNKSAALPTYSMLYLAGASANRTFALTGRDDIAGILAPPQFIPLLI